MKRKKPDQIIDRGDVETITSLKPLGGFTLRVKFNDGQTTDADLSGLIAKSRHFGVFADDPAAFQTVKIISEGGGIGWDNGLDYSAGALKRLAAAQSDMSGLEFSEWLTRHELTIPEAADVLGVSERTVKNYKVRKSPVPAAIKIACLAADREPTLIYSRVRPHNKRGRPLAHAAK